MKQNFKIGKIFLLVVALVCVSFNCKIGFCNDGVLTPELLGNCGELGGSQVVSPTVEDINKVMKQNGFGQDDKASASKQKAKQKNNYMLPDDNQLPSFTAEEINKVMQQNGFGQDDKASASKQEAKQKNNYMLPDDNQLPSFTAEEINKVMQQNGFGQDDKVSASKQEVKQQDQKNIKNEDNGQQNKRIKVVPTRKNVYLPVDISNSVFDSTVVAMKNVDNFNIENEYFGIKVGFDYNLRLKKNEEDDFNKYLILNPKFFGIDNVYLSVFNYHNFLKNRHTNSEDFKKNYYTLYTKFNMNEINSVYFGAGIGYIPFESMIDNSDKNFKKYMLFASLNTDFDLILFGNDVHFSNLLTLDFNLLRSNYLVNSNKSNEYIKIKDGILLNYEINSLIDLFAGVDFGVYTMHRQFRKNIGLNKNTEYNLIAGVKFEFGSINISLGNRGVALGLNMNY